MSSLPPKTEDLERAPELPLSQRARVLIESTFEALLNGNAGGASGIEPPESIKGQLDLVIDNTRQLSYRDAIVVQLAFWLAHGAQLDTTKRHKGGRSVAGQLGRYLDSKHIRAVADAFQNIGKNTEVLIRGNVAEFDDVLVWAADSRRTIMEIDATFKYTCARIAANARPILAMPVLDRGCLTFAKVAQVLNP